MTVALPTSTLPTHAATRPSRRRAFALAVLVALLLGAGATWWWAGSKTPPNYITAQLSRGSVTRTVSATGTVNPQLTIIVGSYVSGVILELSCDFNTRVKKGQLCATIDPRPYQTAVDQANAELGTAQAQLVKDQTALTYAKTTYDRDVALGKDGFVTRDVVDNALNVEDQAKASVDLDRAAIRQKQALLNAANVNLEYTRIVSPVDGTVVSRNVTIGQTVAASFQTPTLFLIATDLAKMQVDTNVSESDIGGLKLGDTAKFSVEAFPGRSFSGIVTQIRQAPQTVQNVVTYDVIVGVDNADFALMPGMTATTHIVIDQRDQVLRIPDQALRFSPSDVAAPAVRGVARAWVMRDGKPFPVEVTVGLDDDTYSELLAGTPLKAGDAVIIGEQRADGARNTPAVRFGL